MNKMILLGLLAASMVANAAQSTTTVNPSSHITTTDHGHANGQSTTTVTEVKDAKKSKWAGSFASANYMSGNEYSKHKGNTPIESDNTLSIGYKLDNGLVVEGQYNFSMATNNDNLGNSKATYQADTSITQRAPAIRVKGTTATGLSSDPLAWNLRYYIPVDFHSVNTRSNGVVRGAVVQNFVLNPKWNVEAVVDGRVYLNSSRNPKAAVGSDALLRLNPGVSATYAINDNVGLYVYPQGDFRSFDVLRSKLNSEASNVYATEVGGNIQIGKVTLNPAIIEYIDLNSGSYDSTEYDLNLTATF